MACSCDCAVLRRRVTTPHVLRGASPALPAADLPGSVQPAAALKRATGLSVWWDGVLANSLWVPHHSAVVCVPPKSGCTTIRSVLHSMLEGTLPSAEVDAEVAHKAVQTAPAAGSVHEWFFSHPLNLRNIARQAKHRGRHQLLAELLYANATIRRVAALRAPLDRFASALLDKGERLLGPKPYQEAGCLGPKVWANGTADESGECALLGLGTATRLYDAALGALLGSRLPHRTNHHFAPQTYLCRTDRVPYDHVAYIDATSAAADRERGLRELLRAVRGDSARLPRDPSDERLAQLRLNHRPAQRRRKEAPLTAAQRCQFGRVYDADQRALCGCARAGQTILGPGGLTSQSLQPEGSCNPLLGNAPGTFS